jgi:hypothetical protein
VVRPADHCHPKGLSVIERAYSKRKIKTTHYWIGTRVPFEFTASHSKVVRVVASFRFCLYSRKILSSRLGFLEENSSAEMGLRMRSPSRVRLGVGVTGVERLEGVERESQGAGELLEPILAPCCTRRAEGT